MLQLPSPSGSFSCVWYEGAGKDPYRRVRRDLVRVSFLYYEDCPSYDLALQRLREVMDEEGIPNEVEVIKVESEEQARKLRFVGSPTIHVNGQDIDPSSDSRYALTCRAYRLADDRISPLPSKDMIRRAFRPSAKSQPG